MRVGEVSRCCNAGQFWSALAPQTGSWRDDPAEKKANFCHPCRDKAVACPILQAALLPVGSLIFQNHHAVDEHVVKVQLLVVTPLADHSNLGL